MSLREIYTEQMSEKELNAFTQGEIDAAESRNDCPFSQPELVQAWTMGFYFFLNRD